MAVQVYPDRTESPRKYTRGRRTPARPPANCRPTSRRRSGAATSSARPSRPWCRAGSRRSTPNCLAPAGRAFADRDSATATNRRRMATACAGEAPSGRERGPRPGGRSGDEKDAKTHRAPARRSGRQAAEARTARSAASACPTGRDAHPSHFAAPLRKASGVIVGHFDSWPQQMDNCHTEGTIL